MADKVVAFVNLPLQNRQLSFEVRLSLTEFWQLCSICARLELHRNCILRSRQQRPLAIKQKVRTVELEIALLPAPGEVLVQELAVPDVVAVHAVGLRWRGDQEGLDTAHADIVVAGGAGNIGTGGRKRITANGTCHGVRHRTGALLRDGGIKF